MTTIPVPLELGHAACSDPEHLPLVDAAHERPGGPEAQEMKETLCRTCPVNRACFAWGMTHAEVGIWGGVSRKARTLRGAPTKLGTVPDAEHRPPRHPDTANRRKIEQRRTDATTLRLHELGVTGSQVKRWAYQQGLVSTTTGRVALTTIEAWAEAHPQAAAS